MSQSSRSVVLPQIMMSRKIQITNTSTYSDLFEILKFSDDDNYQIELSNGEHLAIGDGVARQFYSQCIDEIIGIGAFTLDGPFMNVDPTNDFWEDQDNIYCLVRLIMLILKDGVLPYHLSPWLLSSIIQKPLADYELEFFLDKKDPDMVSKLAAPGANKIITDELGYESKKDYLEFLLDKNHHRSATEIYRKTADLYSRIAQAFEMTGLQHMSETISLDEHLSGRYQITNEAVYRLLNFTESTLIPLWKEFIYSLSEKDLKNMLLTFTGGLSMNHSILIEVKNLDIDFNAQICNRKVVLNRQLFTDLTTLKNLIISFTNNDTISDYKRVDGHLVRSDGSVPLFPLDGIPNFLIQIIEIRNNLNGNFLPAEENTDSEGEDESQEEN